MATYTLGTEGGGYFNNRGANNPPYSYGTKITVTNGQCWLVSDVSIQMAGNGSTETVYGHIWDDAGVDYWQGSAVSIASDTSAPFGAKNLGDPGTSYLLNNISGANDFWYVGFSKTAADSVNWDVEGASGTTTGTETGDVVNGNLDDFSPTAALARDIVGTFTYVSVTAPGTPTLTATPGNGQVSLSWTTPANGGVAINNYKVYRSGTLIYTLTSATAGSFTDTGRTNGTLYSYTVTATNNVGTGSAGSASATPRTVPSAPTSFTSTANTFGTVALSWVAPVNNGSAITSYTLTRTNGATTVTLTAPSTSVTTYNDTTVAPAVSYTYTLLATNAAGAGASATTTITSLGGIANVWNGTSWVTTLPQVWDGTAWVTAQARMWNGTEWKYGI